MTSNSVKIADLFPPADAALWRRLALRALEGRPFDSLVSTTPEGLAIEPLYPRALAEPPRALRQCLGDWRISQRMDHPEVEAANRMARADLEGGADALTLVVAQAPAARGFGVAIGSEGDLAAALEGVEIDLIPFRIDAGARTLDIARHLAKIARSRRLAAAALDVDFGHDPIGAFARSGALAAPLAEIGREAARMRDILREGGFAGHLFLADGRPYHEAGAGEAQELAAALATGIAYLRLLEAEGVGLQEAGDEIAFLLVADADEYLSLAKFRAMRRLWARVQSACGLAPKPIRLHGETAFRMMTRRDPWANLFRAAMGAFAAGLGGADSIAILPFTLALGLPDDFARRLARNTQLLLLREANLGKIADPVAGAGSFEALTDCLCQRAWTLFQRFEKSGGAIKSLEAGWPQREIAATAHERLKRIAHRAQAIIGAVEFPELEEAPVPVLAPIPAAEPEAHAPAALRCAALPSHRDAQPYENLRAAADAALARTGARPEIFLGCLGQSEVVAAHSTFAANFFAAAGIKAVSDHSFETGEQAVEAFRHSGCKIACICASDALGADAAIALARSLAAAGAAWLCFTGSKGEIEPVLRQAGIAAMIRPGCNAAAILESALARALDR
jgi:methylmalonyl-CoA mutase